MALAAVGPAKAQWVEAKTPHFVVYSDQSEERVRDFADRLERFDRAVRFSTKVDDPPRTDATKLTVFIVPNIATVQRLAGGARGVGGFYIPRVEGPIAVTPRKAGGSDRELDAEAILFHEYAHHIQLATLDRPIPRWLSEGYAEFFSVPRFDRDRAVAVGRAANHRAATFAYGERLPLETMLADKVKGEQVYMMYAYGWLLTHYMMFNPERRAQLNGYLNDMAAGMDGLAAARKNFGNLSKLSIEVDSYLKRKALPVLVLQPHLFGNADIQVRRLSAGASAVMPWRIQSKVGVDEKMAQKVVGEVRRVAASYPNDPLVLASLAEAELDAKNEAAAEAAADRLMQLDPRTIEGRIYKARAMMERAKKAGGNKAATFKAARSILIAANRLDTEDPEPLTYYYKSFTEEGTAPSRNAISAIHYASSLMPQDGDVRLLSALQYARDGKTADARKALVPIAYAPHGGEKADMAKEMIAKLDAGDPKGAVAIAEAAEKKAKEEEEKKKKK
jgi:hypothetical protein